MLGFHRFGLHFSTLSVAVGVALSGSAYGLSAQSTATPNSSSSSSPAPSSGPSGSATAENQIIVYQVLSDMATVLTTRIQTESPSAVFLQDVNGIAEISAYQSFTITTDGLLKYYQAIQGGFHPGGAPNDYLSAAASFVTAVRSSAVYTNQTFQPTTASLTNLLTSSLSAGSTKTPVWSSQNPGDMVAASNAISAVLQRLDAVRYAIAKADDRKDADAQYSALKTALSSSSVDGTLLASIIKGRALTTSLGTNYDVLNLSIDGAGGDTKTLHSFLWELLLPTPRPSYNGGSVISFTLTDSKGKFLDGGMLYKMYGFSKWGGSKLKKSSNF